MKIDGVRWKNVDGLLETVHTFININTCTPFEYIFLLRIYFSVKIWQKDILYQDLPRT